MGKQQVTWKEYCADHELKELQESIDRGTRCRDITEITLKTALNTKSCVMHHRDAFNPEHGFIEHDSNDKGVENNVEKTDDFGPNDFILFHIDKICVPKDRNNMEPFGKGLKGH